MPASRLLAVFALSLCVGGCFPYYYTQRPGATGIVVDAHSGAPIAGALVSLVSYGMQSRPQDDALGVRTAPDGRFEIRPVQRWSLYIVPMRPAPVPAALRVRAPGYQDAEKEISFSMLGPPVEDFGSIAMTRLRPPPRPPAKGT